MDILSRPWALLTLNDLTMLLNSLTISGCNEMDSEREWHKKLLGLRICGRDVTWQIWLDVGKVITKVISYVNRITDFHSTFGEGCRI